MRLFVSYSRKDEAKVHDLVADLERTPASVWHDRELRGGDPWWQDILRRIRECDVFLFALSDNSLASKPCLAELSYARKLGVPILPVQIAHVGKLRLTPVADIQVIDYRDRSLITGMALLDAVQESARQRGPLPEPLPEVPPVPFEYLFRLGSAIGAAQLAPDQQGDFIRQLRECLETEEDEAAREDARELLRALRRRPDITLRNARAVDELLTELDDDSAAGPPPPVRDSRVPAGTEDPGREPVEAVDHEDRGQPTVEGRRRGERSRLRPRLLVGGLVLAVLAAAMTGGFLLLSTSVVVQPAGAAGPYPFTDPPGVEVGQEAETTDGTVSGDTRGLYGGAGTGVCDAGGLADHLEGDPQMAAAWAAVLGVRPDGIRRVLGTFTPVALRTDTAVTNHGYRDGRATPFQAVLQAGTAVLVDERGVPRVRCACGNPLLPPETRLLARYEGREWPTFSSEAVTVIHQARQTQQVFVLVQPDGEEVVVRPRGTPGDQDVPADPADAEAARTLSDEKESSGSTDPADPTDSGAGDPADPTDSGAGDPADPTDSGAGDPADPTDSGAGDPADPTDSGSTDPADPTDSGAGDPADPTDSGAGDPADPTDSGAGDPADPTDSGSTDPADPTDSGAGDPADPTDSGAGDPADPTDPAGPNAFTTPEAG
jgi:hypothetical protein